MKRRPGRGPLEVAVVGMACRFPDAGGLHDFWANVLAGGVAPAERGPTHLGRDEGDPEMTLMLHVARESLVDAGYPPGGFDGRKAEVIIGRGARADLGSSRKPSGPHTAQDQPGGNLAARVADRLGLGGASCVVDASGASLLVALDLGARSLAERRARLVLVGEACQADDAGMVPAYGVGIVVLKRRSDAERDGDRIYALLQGLGIAGDDRSTSTNAPSARGRIRAMRLAYRSSGIDPASVGLVEAHGPRVPAAGRAGRRALRAVYPAVACGRRSLGVASSGIAGLIKAALSLHHQLLPPTSDAGQHHPSFDRAYGPLTFNRSTRPWVHGTTDNPRRAALGVFGFAGINAHAVLEGHPSSTRIDAPGVMPSWASEAILLSAADRAGLIKRVDRLLAWLEHGPAATLKDLAFTLNNEAPAGPARLGLVVRSLADLAGRLEQARKKLGDPGCSSIRDARGLYFWDRPAGKPARVAFLFPGEGSQYPGMLGDLCPHFPEVRALFDTSDRIAREAGASTWPSEVLFGDRSGSDPHLWSAELGVNVVLSAQWALYQLLVRLGIRPDALIGHSSGELLALAASGVVAVDRGFEDRLGELGAIFGGLETSKLLPSARLVAVAAARERVDRAVAGLPIDVAMDNCPHQVVIAGPADEVDAVVDRLKAEGVPCEPLPFDRAYHTAAFAPAIGPIARFFDALAMQPPATPLYSCASHDRMPDDPASIRRLAVDQWTRAVEFRRAVERMLADGIDTFVDVGARGNLAGFVEDTLRGRPSFAVAANLPRRPGPEQLNHLVASLFARGVDLQPDHLYLRRRPVRLDLDRPVRSAEATHDLSARPPSMGLAPATIDRLETPSHPASPSNGLPASTNGHAKPADVAWADHEMGSGPIAASFRATMDVFLDVQRSVMEAWRGVDDAYPTTQTLHEPHPWRGEVISFDEGHSSVSRLTLAIEGDPVAEQHTLGGRRISLVHPEWRGLPVLPFSVMAEMLAQAAASLMPGLSLVELVEVKAHKWIRYEDEPIALEVRAEVDPDRRDSVKVAIHNRRTGRERQPAGPAVFEGVVVFGPDPLGPSIGRPFVLDEPEACRFTPESIYAEQWLFHGPALQAVVGIGPISMEGIEGTLRVLPLAGLLKADKAGRAGAFLTDPIILDNFTHLLGGWGLDRLADDGDVIFPMGMERLTIRGESPGEGADVSCRIKVREMNHHKIRADAEIVRRDGTVWMTIEGWEDWRFRWPGRYRDGFRRPDRIFLGEPLDLPVSADKAAAVWLEPPADMGRPVWRDVLEFVQLGRDERARYLALGGPDFRRTHRLWGRIAAKEAARRIWLAASDLSVYPADLMIVSDSNGRPHLASLLGADRPEIPSISIAHVDGVAVALAVLDPDARPGIDVEPIVERPSGFESAAFLPGEVALLGDRSGLDRAERVARLWCVKEAAAKATGLGFVDGPGGVEVVDMDEDGRMTVELRGGLATACPALGSRPFLVETNRRGDHAWAWTVG